jgi:hypothetical protein
VKKANAFFFSQIHRELLARENITQTKPTIQQSSALTSTHDTKISSSSSFTSSTIIDQLFGSTIRIVVQCNVCHQESIRELRVHYHSLLIPTAYHVM